MDQPQSEVETGLPLDFRVESCFAAPPFRSHSETRKNPRPKAPLCIRRKGLLKFDDLGHRESESTSAARGGLTA